MVRRSPTLFEEGRMTMAEAIRLTRESLELYGARAAHWGLCWSGGKDSTALLTLAPILHWRVCHVWDWLKIHAPSQEYGDWPTETLADAYGGDEAEEVNARTGCVGCPLASKDTALDALIGLSDREAGGWRGRVRRSGDWSYLEPLKGLRLLWRELREPRHRLRQPGGERRQDGSLVENQHRMGPLTLTARRMALDRVLDIQRAVNEEADRIGRPQIDILNAEERGRIEELIAAGTWPQRWTGGEPLATEPFLEDGAQGFLDWEGSFRDL